jgi:hypothetical protein
MEKLFCVYLAKLLRMKAIDSSNKIELIKEEEEIFKMESNITNVKEKDSNALKTDKIERILISILKELKENKNEEDLLTKWKLAALVMDKLFFYLSIIYSVVTFCSILLPLPGFFRSS